MSALNILGGIGAGLQQGVGFMQQKKMQDEQLRLAQERNTMLAEQANRQAKEFEQKQAEVERVKKLSEMRNGIYQNYPDANRYQREQMFVDEAVKSGMFRGDELDTAFAGVEKLKQQFGAEAYGAAINGDIKPLQQVLGQKGIAVDYDPSGKNLLLWQEGNARDAAGNLQPRTISVDGLLQMDVMAEARRRQREAAKLNQESRKTESEITKNVAQAGNYRAQAAGRTPYLEGPGGQLYPNPAFSGGKSGGSRSGGGADGGARSPTEIDPQDVVRLVGDTGEISPATIASQAEQIVAATPALGSGQAIEYARRMNLPEEDPARIVPDARLNKETGNWYLGFDDPRVGEIRVGRSNVDPYGNLVEDKNEAKNQRAAIQAADEDWLAAVAQTTPPEVMGVLGPYINGTEDPRELLEADDRVIQAVLSTPTSSERDRAAAMAALLAKSRPGLFEATRRINDNARSYVPPKTDAWTPQPVPVDVEKKVRQDYSLDQREEVSKGSGVLRPSADNKAFGQASSEAQSALLLLRTKNPTLKASDAERAMQALEKYPELASRLKVTDDELWALKFTAGSKTK